jgi:hypothetical protein
LLVEWGPWLLRKTSGDAGAIIAGRQKFTNNTLNLRQFEWKFHLDTKACISTADKMYFTTNSSQAANSCG